MRVRILRDGRYAEWDGIKCGATDAARQEAERQGVDLAGVEGTGKPGAGDLVVWVEEVSGTGTLDFSITAIYEDH